MYEFNPLTYKYPIEMKNGGMRTGSFKAKLKSFGIPDINDREAVIRFLNKPGSRAKVKWAGMDEFIQYGSSEKASKSNTEENKMGKSVVTVTTFEKDGKSYPTIALKADAEAKFGFTFGISKAKLIVENIDAIRKFVIDNTHA